MDMKRLGGKILDLMDMMGEDAVLNVLSLRMLQVIHFWNVKDHDDFVRASGICPAINLLGPVLQANEAAGNLANIMDTLNTLGLGYWDWETEDGVSGEEAALINLRSYLADEAAGLVIAAVRLSQLGKFDLAKAVYENIEARTGNDLRKLAMAAYRDKLSEASNE